jgi:hypothetical protein
MPIAVRRAPTDCEAGPFATARVRGGFVFDQGQFDNASENFAGDYVEERHCSLGISLATNRLIGKIELHANTLIHGISREFISPGVPALIRRKIRHFPPRGKHAVEFLAQFRQCPARRALLADRDRRGGIRHRQGGFPNLLLGVA